MAEVRSAYRAVEILQTTMTVAAIALALSALMQEEGPTLRDVKLIPLTLLVAGFVAVVSSAYAVAALHQELELTASDLIAVGREHSFHETSVIVATWALAIFGAAYFWSMVAGAP